MFVSLLIYTGSIVTDYCILSHFLTITWGKVDGFYIPLSVQWHTGPALLLPWAAPPASGTMDELTHRAAIPSIVLSRARDILPLLLA